MRKSLLYFFAFATAVVACTKGSSDASSSAASGQGGSLARFTIIGSNLYMADDRSLISYDISNGGAPVFRSSTPVGFGIETIYPYKDKLFIGSRDGMYIYSVTNPAKPQLEGSARHVRSCDPVVANDTVAYVTLKGGTACGPAQDGLYVYNIKNINSPVQLKIFALAKSGGLGLKDTTLFICREDSGLAVLNVKNPLLPTVVKSFKDDVYYDVIPLNDLLVCMVKTGILLYDISDVKNIRKIKTIAN